jgi:hypothetical protein
MGGPSRHPPTNSGPTVGCVMPDDQLPPTQPRLTPTPNAPGVTAEKPAADATRTAPPFDPLTVSAADPGAGAGPLTGASDPSRGRVSRRRGRRS